MVGRVGSPLQSTQCGWVCGGVGRIMANMIHAGGFSLRVGLVGLGLMGLVLLGAVVLGRARESGAVTLVDSPEVDAVQTAVMPAIDAAAPLHTQTATFALG